MGLLHPAGRLHAGGEGCQDIAALLLQRGPPPSSCFDKARALLALRAKADFAPLYTRPDGPLPRLLVGSTPSTCTKVHNASRRFKISWHIPSVADTPQRLPASSRCSTSRSAGAYTPERRACSVPSHTRCHHLNIWCALASKPRQSLRRPRHGPRNRFKVPQQWPSIPDATAPDTSCRHCSVGDQNAGEVLAPTARVLPGHHGTSGSETPSPGSSPATHNQARWSPDATGLIQMRDPLRVDVVRASSRARRPLSRAFSDC